MLKPNISNADYQADPAIGSSNLKNALKAPAVYRATADGLIPFTSSPAKDRGTIVHTLILEPETFHDTVAVAPEFKGKGSVAAKAEFAAENEGKIIVSLEVIDQCRSMVDSLLSLPEFAAILGESENELSGWYDDPITGLRCRYRPDIRTDWCIADVKTCADASPDGFSRAIQNFGYHISAAHYLTGDSVLMGTDHRQFIFACVESSPPYLPALYVLNEEDLQLGEWQRKKAMSIIKQCTDSGEWPSYNSSIATGIGVPHWAKREFLEGMI